MSKLKEKECGYCGKVYHIDEQCYACKWISATEEVDMRFAHLCAEMSIAGIELLDIKSNVVNEGSDL